MYWAKNGGFLGHGLAGESYMHQEMNVFHACKKFEISCQKCYYVLLAVNSKLTWLNWSDHFERKIRRKCNLLDIVDANIILVTTWPNTRGWASIIGIDSIIPYIIYMLDHSTE